MLFLSISAFRSARCLARVAQRAERRTRDRNVPGSKLACSIWFFPSARKLVGIARWPSSLVVLIGPSPHHCSPTGRALLHSSVKTSTRCFHWGEETAVHAIVGSIIWAFRRQKKPRCREMSTRGYALHSECPKFSFLSCTQTQVTYAPNISIFFFVI